MLKIELKEIQRPIEVTKRLLPKIPERQEKVRVLKVQLGVECLAAEKLSRDLETPGNSDRWLQLEGHDADMDQLKARVAKLEGLISDKHDHLLEKELVLEEI